MNITQRYILQEYIIKYLKHVLAFSYQPCQFVPHWIFSIANCIGHLHT